MFYCCAAWFQVSHGKADVAAIFKTKTSYETAGWVTAQSGCWSMLKGGFVVNATGPAELYFQVSIFLFPSKREQFIFLDMIISSLIAFTKLL